MSTLSWCYLGRVGYEDARRRQVALALRRASGALEADLLLLLEHDAIVTLGRSAAAPAGRPYVRVDRGGGATYHGPGQLVVYPVVKLGAGGRGVRAFVAALERAMCGVAAELGAPARRREGLPGAWVGSEREPAKVGFVGLSVRRGVSLHGAALNIERRAERGFLGFAPCGIAELRVSSVEAEVARAVPPLDQVAPLQARACARELGYAGAVRVIPDALESCWRIGA